MTAQTPTGTGSDVADRVVLVTGAAKRIGRAICHGLAERGAHVVVHYRSSADAADGLVAELRTTGVDAWSLQADLSDPVEAEALLGAAAAAAGRPVDAVVNNASVFQERTLQDAAYDDLDRMMRLHVWAPLALTRALASSGVEDAAVVNLLDTRVTSYDPGHYPYIISKRALADMTRTLAKHLAPDVRVNGVAPGAILPPEGKGEDHMERLRKAAPLQRLGAPAQVVEAVLYLLGAANVTGQVIFVDGGRHLV